MGHPSEYSIPVYGKNIRGVTFIDMGTVNTGGVRVLVKRIFTCQANDGID